MLYTCTYHKILVITIVRVYKAKYITPLPKFFSHFNGIGSAGGILSLRLLRFTLFVIWAGQDRHFDVVSNCFEAVVARE